MPPEEKKEIQTKPRATLTGKTAQAMLWFLLFCLIAGFRTDPRQLVASLRFEPTQGVSWYSSSPSVAEQPVVSPEEKSETAPVVKADLNEAAKLLGIDPKAEDLLGDVRRIEDPTGRAMSSFYEALTRTVHREPGAVTRILHYGDSLVVVDFLTGETRRRLQGRFGDAGHGFMMAGKPWPWYQHWDVSYRTGSWTVDGIMNPKSREGYYGLGGFAFDGAGPSQFVEYGTQQKSEFGRRASRFEVYYLIRPGGGSFDVYADDVLQTKVKTAGPIIKSGVYTLKVKDGAHKFRVQCSGDGPVRLFGGVLEREGPGLVYDTLGINGGRARTLERINTALWAEQLRLRRPDLVILNFGTNESEDEDRPMAVVETDYGNILRTIRAAVPEASCLVMSPADRAARLNGKLTTKTIIPRLVATQRRAALKAGCAFYDTYQAMGGHGSMARWYESKPRLCAGDMTHPNRLGADLLGGGLYRSFVTGLIEYAGLTMQAKAAGAPLPVPAEPLTLYAPLWPAQPEWHPPLPEQPRLPF